MIGFVVTRAELERRIDAERPGWLARASTRTQTFIQNRKYAETSSIWSEVKSIWSDLQHSKCAYCERRLPALDHGGAVEHDLEHFRPKGEVAGWPGEGAFDFSMGDPLPAGYYWLAYDPTNYAVACKKCNSPLKKSWFPIRGPRADRTVATQALDRHEDILLLRPVLEGPSDLPEASLEFRGINPVVVAGADEARVLVTIAFFALDKREELWRERAERLVELGNALLILESNLPAEVRDGAGEDVRRLLDPTRSTHVNCVRSASALYEADPQAAADIFTACRAYLDSQS